MSRLQSGALRFQARPVGYEEVVPAALASLSGPTDTVDITLDETLPRVQADPALLERAVANLAANAIAASAPDGRVRIEAGAVGGRVDLRVVDRGPGHPGGRSRADLRAVPAPRRRRRRASASGWRWPRASSRRWAASSPSRTPPAAA